VPLRELILPPELKKYGLKMCHIVLKLPLNDVSGLRLT